MTAPVFDDELLGLAERTLQAMDFSTALARLNDVPCLLAENELFILAIVTTTGIDDLAAVDEAISLQLASEVAAAGVAEKQWDVYLVLLTSAHLPPSEGDKLYRLSYDTHYLRRLVRTDVIATAEGMRTALRTFAEMPESAGGAALQDPLAEMETALRENGVSPESAHRVVDSFRSTGEIADA